MKLEHDDGLGWLFSSDDHVLETPDLYRSRMPSKFRDRAARIERTVGEEFWVIDGARVDANGLEAAAGKPFDTFSTAPVHLADMDEAYYDARARLAQMDADGIGVQVLFPSSITQVWGTRWLRNPDREFALASVRAYNDWIFEEWRGIAAERFIPAILLPLWDVREAVAEAERMAGLGAKAVSLNSGGLPHLGFPHMNDPYWDPLWSAFAATGIVVCNHIEGVDRALSGGSSAFRHEFDDVKQPLAPFASLSALNAMTATAEYVFSPVFRKYPDLQFVLTECGIGWVPFILQKARHVWTRQRAWAGPMDDLDPVEIFRRNISVSFIDDSVGIEIRNRIGVDRILWENDYPHTDCNFPNARQSLRAQLAGLDPAEVAAIAHGNAERIFRHCPLWIASAAGAPLM
jgi:predicted TIM-barrel fold metal-dependent hydrolase